MLLPFGLLFALHAASPPAPKAVGPSRSPQKGCAWERASDRKLGLEAWVQRCDFGFRRIDFRFSKTALTQHYSDGGEAYPVVEVFDLLPGERETAGIRRLFDTRTDKKLAGRCVLAPDKETKPPAGVERYTFVPDKAYEKELAAKGEPDGVPDPPCGDFGESPDGIGYWEAQPRGGARKVMFVSVGQDEPLFDEQTLRLMK
jgi:hypothetical protein